jgi:CO/xanthine dehydrogenase Mo-binding subunit
MASVEVEETVQRPVEVVRTDALEKVLGETKYTTDNVNEDALYLRVVRSPHPHALVKRIDVSKAEHIQGVLRVATAKDIPGSNYIGYVVPDRPLLCHDKVRFVGDNVALVVADTPESAELGVQAVDVRYEPLPAVFDSGEALSLHRNHRPVARSAARGARGCVRPDDRPATLGTRPRAGPARSVCAA